MSTIARFPSRSIKTGLAIATLAIALAGCSSDKWGFPYRAGIQQGNWITQEQVALLQPGMSREQVRFALGSPTLTSVLHADRWDYPYYFRPGRGPVEERQFTVWFENDRLLRWHGDEQPSMQPFQINMPGVPNSQPHASPAQDVPTSDTSAQDLAVAPGTDTEPIK